MGGFQFSPVVEAFLKGQSQQTGMITDAKNLELRKKQIDAAIQEAQDRHQTDRERLALDHQIFELNFEKAQAEEHDRLTQQYSNFPATAPGTTSTTLQAPGINMAIPGIPNVSPSGGGPGTPAFNIQQPNQQLGIAPGIPHNETTVTPPEPGTPLVVDSPFGPISLNMPESAEKQAKKLAAAKAEGELPSKIAEVKANVEPRVAAMLEVAEVKENAARAMAADHNANQLDIANANREAAQARWEAGMYMNLSKLMPGVDFGKSGGLQSAVNDRMKSLGMGQTTFNSGSYLDQNAKTEAAKQGITFVDPKFNDKVYPNAANAVQYMDNVGRLAKTLPPGTSIGGRAKNVVSEKLGVTGLSSYASQFNMFLDSEIPKLDLAVGLSPGTLARSPKLVNLFKQLYPLPGDTPAVVNEKKINGVDIFLTSTQSNLAKLSAQQKEWYWQKIVDDNPELMDLKPIADKLRKAVTTGNYNSLNPDLYSNVASGYQK